MSETLASADLLTEKWTRALTFEGFLDYSRKNIDGFRGGYEKAEIDEELAKEVKAFEGDVCLLVMGADWCGDVVANLPAVAKLADLNPAHIQVRVLDRDRNEDLLAYCMTDGTKSIPKIIVCSRDMSSYSLWGPRPTECQRIMTDNKGKMPKEEIYPMLREWYMNDKHRTLLKEIWEAIKARAEVN